MMKVVIFAGGYGTRLSEETDVRPKPMVEIGGKPILWHIMKIYSSYGFNEFVVLLGYKGYYIKEYFANYFLHQSDVTLDIQTGKMEILNNSSEPWKVTLLDTGVDSMTGGRLKRAKNFLCGETFMLTYGDGVADINIKDLVDFHKRCGKIVTVTAIQPEGRFGALQLDGAEVKSFFEKPMGDGNWVNGGFMVCEPQILEYIEDDMTIFEDTPLKKLVQENNLVAFKHTGFWKSMDSLRDKIALNALWVENNARWKVW